MKTNLNTLNLKTETNNVNNIYNLIRQRKISVRPL